MIDIINAYVEAGYSCVLITGRLVERNIPLNPKVKLERMIKYNRTTIIKRLYTWVWGFIQIWSKVSFKFRKDFLFIISNPPLAPLVTMLVRNPYQLLIFDIYPDALVELGYMSEKTFFIKWWRKTNRKVFANASSVFTISNSMKRVLDKYSQCDSVKVVSLWTDVEFFKPIEKEKNPFIIEYDLSRKFVVLYSGNVGLSSEIEVLVDIAEEVNSEDIVFIVIGDGAKKVEMQKKARRLNLTNMLFLPWQAPSNLPHTFASADIAVISLGSKASKLALPSKLFNFLSAGVPLLCIASKESELSQMVEENKCGRGFESNDIIGMKQFIFKTAESKEFQSEMSINALKASESFTVTNLTCLLDATILVC